jgi:hypothetical protein
MNGKGMNGWCMNGVAAWMVPDEWVVHDWFGIIEQRMNEILQVGGQQGLCVELVFP